MAWAGKGALCSWERGCCVHGGGGVEEAEGQACLFLGSLSDTHCSYNKKYVHYGGYEIFSLSGLFASFLLRSKQEPNFDGQFSRSDIICKMS